MITITTIGEYIKKHRLLSGYKSQRKLAKRCGVSAATISRIEKGIQKPEVKTLRELSKALKTTTFKELMAISGYIELNKKNESVSTSLIKDVFEEESPIKIDLLSLKNVQIYLDNIILTPEELDGIIYFLRAYRKLEND